MANYCTSTKRQERKRAPDTKKDKAKENERNAKHDTTKHNETKEAIRTIKTKTKEKTIKPNESKQNPKKPIETPRNQSFQTKNPSAQQHLRRHQDRWWYQAVKSTRGSTVKFETQVSLFCVYMFFFFFGYFFFADCFVFG